MIARTQLSYLVDFGVFICARDNDFGGLIHFAIRDDLAMFREHGKRRGSHGSEWHGHGSEWRAWHGTLGPNRNTDE